MSDRTLTAKEINDMVGHAEGVKHMAELFLAAIKDGNYNKSGFTTSQKTAIRELSFYALYNKAKWLFQEYAGIFGDRKK